MPTTTRSDQLRTLADFLDEHPIDELTVTTGTGRLGLHPHSVAATVAVIDAVGADGWVIDQLTPALKHDGLFGFEWVTLFTPLSVERIPSEVLEAIA